MQLEAANAGKLPVPEKGCFLFQRWEVSMVIRCLLGSNGIRICNELDSRPKAAVCQNSNSAGVRQENLNFHDRLELCLVPDQTSYLSTKFHADATDIQDMVEIFQPSS